MIPFSESPHGPHSLLIHWVIVGILTVVALSTSLSMPFDAYGLLEQLKHTSSFAASVLGVFVHVDELHFIGNLVWFAPIGALICSNAGWRFYLTISGGAALLGAVADAAFHAHSIGYSGVISALLGAAVVAFPRASIRCVFLFGIRNGTCDVPVSWLCLAWVALDASGLVALHSGIELHNTSYWGHLSGTVAGALVAWVAVRDRLAKAIPYTGSLVDLARRRVGFPKLPTISGSPVLARAAGTMLALGAAFHLAMLVVLVNRESADWSEVPVAPFLWLTLEVVVSIWVALALTKSHAVLIAAIAIVVAWNVIRGAPPIDRAEFMLALFLLYFVRETSTFGPRLFWPPHVPPEPSRA